MARTVTVTLGHHYEAFIQANIAGGSGTRLYPITKGAKATIFGYWVNDPQPAAVEFVV